MFPISSLLFKLGPTLGLHGGTPGKIVVANPARVIRDLKGISPLLRIYTSYILSYSLRGDTEKTPYLAKPYLCVIKAI